MRTLRTDQLDLHAGRARVLGKGSRSRVVLVPEPLVAILLEFLTEVRDHLRRLRCCWPTRTAWWPPRSPASGRRPSHARSSWQAPARASPVDIIRTNGYTPTQPAWSAPASTSTSSNGGLATRASPPRSATPISRSTTYRERSLTSGTATCPKAVDDPSRSMPICPCTRGGSRRSGSSYSTATDNTIR